jgi:hypothetical protein
MVLAVPVAAGAARAWQQAQPAPSSPQFATVSGNQGIDFMHQLGDGSGDYVSESGGSGGAWLDYDVDGRLDVVLVNGLSAWRDPSSGSGHALFRNYGERFGQAPAAAGVRDRVWGSGATVADVDNDGFPDLFITALGADRLYRNNGDGTFTPWPVGVEGDGWGTSATFTDWDNDGFVDLYVARYLDFDQEGTPAPGDGVCFYRGIEVFCSPETFEGSRDLFYRNAGDGSFLPWMESEVDPDATYGFALVATDCDDDGLPEIYVANDANMNLLHRRTSEGGLEDWALFSGAGYSGDGREQAGMGATAADFDGDGLLDIFVTNFQNDSNTLYRNLGGCSFEDVTSRRRLATSSYPFMGWAAQFFDADGDGDQDLYIANGHIHPQLDAAGLESWAQRNLFYLNLLRESGIPDFVEVGGASGTGMTTVAPSRGALRGDYDNDGDTDLLVTNVNDSPTLLRNDGPIHSPALRLSLVGRSSNRSAYGARVRIESGGVSQVFELRDSDGYQGGNDARLLVHLPGGTADLVEVRWPGGGVTLLEDQAPSWMVLDEERGVIARRSW